MRRVCKDTPFFSMSLRATGGLAQIHQKVSDIVHTTLVIANIAWTVNALKCFQWWTLSRYHQQAVPLPAGVHGAYLSGCYRLVVLREIWIVPVCSLA